jgi:hypothetical protein
MAAGRGLGTSFGAFVIAVIVLPGLPAAAESFNRGALDFDKRCYVVGAHPTVGVSGSSFDPGLNLELRLKRNETVLQTLPVTSDGEGRFALSLPNPGEPVFAEVVEAGSDLQLAGKTLNATKFEAGYKFGTRHKGPTHVKDFMVLSGSGFAGGQQGTRGSNEADKLYLHRVGPDRRTRTEELSTLQPCGRGGTNRVTGRPLFTGGGPRAKVQAGRWQFQFDTSARYANSTKEKIVLTLRVDRRGIVTPGEQTKRGVLAAARADVGDRHPGVTDPLDGQPSTVHGQVGIALRHRDLRSSG